MGVRGLVIAAILLCFAGWQWFEVVVVLVLYLEYVTYFSKVASFIQCNKRMLNLLSQRWLTPI